MRQLYTCASQKRTCHFSVVNTLLHPVPFLFLLLNCPTSRKWSHYLRVGKKCQRGIASSTSFFLWPDRIPPIRCESVFDGVACSSQRGHPAYQDNFQHLLPVRWLILIRQDMQLWCITADHKQQLAVVVYINIWRKPLPRGTDPLILHWTGHFRSLTYLQLD